MPGMTLRLEDDDHRLLRLLSIVHHKSANQLIVDLLRAEFDRALPGKREAAQQADGTATQRFLAALGVDAPTPSPAAKEWARNVIDSLHEDSDEQARPAA